MLPTLYLRVWSSWLIPYYGGPQVPTLVQRPGTLHWHHNRTTLHLEMQCGVVVVRMLCPAFGRRLALILFIQTLALYKSFTYLLTYLWVVTEQPYYTHNSCCFTRRTDRSVNWAPTSSHPQGLPAGNKRRHLDCRLHSAVSSLDYLFRSRRCPISGWLPVTRWTGTVRPPMRRSASASAVRLAAMRWRRLAAAAASPWTNCSWRATALSWQTQRHATSSWCRPADIQLAQSAQKRSCCFDSSPTENYSDTAVRCRRRYRHWSLPGGAAATPWRYSAASPRLSCRGTAWSRCSNDHHCSGIRSAAPDTHPSESPTVGKTFVPTATI